MAEIKSLADCFNPDISGITSYLMSALDAINVNLEQQKNDIGKNDDIYGKMSFHCGGDTLLDKKMNKVKDELLPSAIDTVDLCKKNIQIALWKKRRRDVQIYIKYCDEQIKLSENGYNKFRETEDINKFTMSYTYEKRQLRNQFSSYIRFTEEKENARVEFSKATQKIASLASSVL